MELDAWRLMRAPGSGLVLLHHAVRDSRHVVPAVRLPVTKKGGSLSSGCASRKAVRNSSTSWLTPFSSWRTSLGGSRL